MTDQLGLGLGAEAKSTDERAREAIAETFARRDVALEALAARLGCTPAEALAEMHRRRADVTPGLAEAAERYLAAPPPEEGELPADLADPFFRQLPAGVRVAARTVGASDFPRRGGTPMAEVLDAGADHHRRIGMLLAPGGPPWRFYPTCPTLFTDRVLRRVEAETPEAWAEAANAALAERTAEEFGTCSGTEAAE